MSHAFWLWSGHYSKLERYQHLSRTRISLSPSSPQQLTPGSSVQILRLNCLSAQAEESQLVAVWLPPCRQAAQTRRVLTRFMRFLAWLLMYYSLTLGGSKKLSRAGSFAYLMLGEVCLSRELNKRHIKCFRSVRPALASAAATLTKGEAMSFLFFSLSFFCC